MKNVKLNKRWDELQSSYWFLLTMIAIGAIVLALVLLAIDRSGSAGITKVWWLYVGGPDGARSLLSAIASSMVTVAGTAFSITIVALQLASSNFGPRLLRNFMRDKGNQVVLGTFIGTFIYCLLVLRTIHSENYNLFVPQLAVTVAIGLAILSTAVLIYFIHEQLVEIALRAISPAVNDPFTAIRCIDRLDAGLSCIAQRVFPSPYRYDAHGILRVIAEPITFEELVDRAFDQIRQYARSDTAVTIRLLEAIALIANYTRTGEHRAVLKRHAEMIKRGSREGIAEICDRRDVEAQYERVIQALH